MGTSFWFLLFLGKYLCLFSLNSIVLGLFLLLCSFSMSVLLSVHSLSWYSLMFFLMYMGGLLVLFMYISSLKFNPTFYFSESKAIVKFFSKVNLFMLFVCVLTQITWNFHSFTWCNLDSKNFSLNLFKEKELLFLMNVGLLLLMVLWVMSKLSFRTRSALRPFF